MHLVSVLAGAQAYVYLDEGYVFRVLKLLHHNCGMAEVVEALRQHNNKVLPQLLLAEGDCAAPQDLTEELVAYLAATRPADKHYYLHAALPAGAEDLTDTVLEKFIEENI